MRPLTSSRILLTALTLLLALAASAPASAAVDDDGDQPVRIERRIVCHGEDCSELDADGAKAIFIDENGEPRALDGVHQWVATDGPHQFKMLMRGGKGGYLGVGLTDLTPELRAHFGVPESAGVMVSKVVAGTPAERAGILVGDIVTLVDTDEVASGGALAHAIGSHEKGDDVTLEIWRDGRAQQVTATLDESTAPKMAMMPSFHHRMGHGGEGERHVMIECDGESEDCGHGLEDFDCGGAEECEVKVMCAEGACSCTVNGEDHDCAGIPGVPSD